MSATTILDRPLLRFGRAVCGELEPALGREWLVTNGLGGYASGTIAGVNTRRYHGLLVAALAPPVERVVLVGGTVEWAVYDGRRYPLSTHEYADGTIDPNGFVQLQSFHLEGTIPVWTYALGDALLERRVWLAQGSNTTYLSWTLARGTLPLQLEITPLVTYRGFHELRRGQGWQPECAPVAHGVRVDAGAGARPYRLLLPSAEYTPAGGWWWNFRHRAEEARGLDAVDDLYAPGFFRLSLAPGQAAALVCTTEEAPALDHAAALEAERARQRELLRQAGAEAAEPALQQLTLAADQFIVARPPGRSVIAGYHWFGDWGRDTMIALPGLTLATGRHEDAAAILRTFAPLVRDGLLPNDFPDAPGAEVSYTSADAALWYLLAVYAYDRVAGDPSFVDDLLPTLRGIVDHYAQGTRYGIGVDPADGLLRAGTSGLQLTWMDVKIGDWVVTPRAGKPVELQALWYNALKLLAGWLRDRSDPAADGYEAAAARARASFAARFVRPGLDHLADVVDGPQGDDLACRPNQLFAVSLPFALLEGDAAARVVAEAGRQLLISYGLRSLAPAEPRYAGRYQGDPRQRDAVYHQGTAWAWLIGAYVDACVRLQGSPAPAAALLDPFRDQLCDAGLGSLSEIFDGDPPHHSRGCIAQAWSVAEVLRCRRGLFWPVR
ncbi:MAG TPA: amylo-alpha-1,6-glucosidase [Thermomicrobiaceae bacterium]|nr:amylo-alpha-1,6-glucosidase [Thermomicrobiaceae bacterium]